MNWYYLYKQSIVFLNKIYLKFKIFLWKILTKIQIINFKLKMLIFNTNKIF